MLHRFSPSPPVSIIGPLVGVPAH
jgi:hypothetical protein